MAREDSFRSYGKALMAGQYRSALPIGQSERGTTSESSPDCSGRAGTNLTNLTRKRGRIGNTPSLARRVSISREHFVDRLATLSNLDRAVVVIRDAHFRIDAEAAIDRRAQIGGASGLVLHIRCL